MDLQPSKKYRYAAHRLEFGRFYMRYPLIEFGERGEILLDLFSEEAERIVFISGTIKLLRQGSFTNGGGEEEEVSLDEMKSLIEEEIGIEVVLPEIVHG